MAVDNYDFCKFLFFTKIIHTCYLPRLCNLQVRSGLFVCFCLFLFLFLFLFLCCCCFVLFCFVFVVVVVVVVRFFKKKKNTEMSRFMHMQIG